MHIPRFYIDQPIQEHVEIELNAAVAHHIAKVLRMSAGRQVILFNGACASSLPEKPHGEYQAELIEVSKKKVVASVQQFMPKQSESALAIELGVCLIKNDRMDWLLQKAAELGVSAISPLLSDYTDVKLPADRLEKKMHHWQQVLISACEQSGRTSIPSVNAPQKVPVWLASVQVDKKYCLHPYVQHDAGHSGVDSVATTSVALLVGPEGGLSDSEVNLAQQHAFAGMTLGPRILRAETAPLVAMTLLQNRYGDI